MICPNCGKETDNNIQCIHCGSMFGQINTVNNIQNDIPFNRPAISKRSIAVAIILTFVTCGIYGLYWFIVMTNESNSISDSKTASGGIAFLLTIITCGIYGLYWNYKMGEKIHNAGKKYNISIENNGVLYLILYLIGLGIISYALMQKDLNKFAQ